MIYNFARKNCWKKGCIGYFHSMHNIACYREGEIEDRGEMKVIDVVKKLNVNQKKYIAFYNTEIM
jgi:hypothetical protein